jgi:hypothetical protein
LEGSASCELCAEGSFTDSTAQSVCEECPEGYSSDEGAVACFEFTSQSEPAATSSGCLISQAGPVPWVSFWIFSLFTLAALMWRRSRYQRQP